MEFDMGWNSFEGDVLPMPSLDIDRDHVFRHAKELVNATHGRYLEGKMQLPMSEGFVHLSTIPSSETGSALIVHPNLLHVTIMDSSTRKAKWKSTLTENGMDTTLLASSRSIEVNTRVLIPGLDWKIELKIHNEKAYLLSSRDGELPVGSIQDGTLIFGDSGLLLTIITPLQDTKRGDSEGVRVKDVIANRLKNEEGRQTSTTADATSIAEKYTNKKKNPLAKIEMHRCRIKAEFFDLLNGQPISKPVRSQDICNSKHNDVGALELHDMSDPRASCTRGGFKVLLSSEFKAPTLKTKTEMPIHAVFVIERNGIFYPAQNVLWGFNQISLAKEHFQIHHNTLAFIVPEQDPDVISPMRMPEDCLKIALYRPHDEKYSAKKFPFRYVEHTEPCNFCTVMGVRSKIPPKKQAGPNTPRRHKSKSTAPRGSASSDSGIPTSPSDTGSELSPLPKRVRLSSSTDRCLPYSPVQRGPVSSPWDAGNFHQASPASATSDSQISDVCTVGPMHTADQHGFTTQALHFSDLVSLLCEGNDVDMSVNVPEVQSHHQPGDVPVVQTTSCELDNIDMGSIVDLLAADSNHVDMDHHGFSRIDAPSDDLVAKVRQLHIEEDEETSESEGSRASDDSHDCTASNGLSRGSRDLFAEVKRLEEEERPAQNGECVDPVSHSHPVSDVAAKSGGAGNEVRKGRLTPTANGHVPTVEEVAVTPACGVVSFSELDPTKNTAWSLVIFIGFVAIIVYEMLCVFQAASS